MYQAVSISSAILPLVCRDGFTAQILAPFPKACNLITSDGEVIVLASRAVGDGPLSIVLEEADFSAWQRAWPVRGDGSVLTIAGKEQVKLVGATPWNPMPDYGALARVGKGLLETTWARLDAVLAARAPVESLARLEASAPPSPSLLPHQRRAHRHIGALSAAYADGDLSGLAAHAAALAGLGPGLTPAGDDWLAGWLIGLRVREAVNPHAARLKVGEVAEVVVSAAAGRTHALSMALLRAAGRGLVNARWQALLAALAGHAHPGLEAAAEGILTYGETSGSDMLAGFLSALPGKARL